MQRQTEIHAAEALRSGRAKQQVMQLGICPSILMFPVKSVIADLTRQGNVPQSTLEFPDTIHVPAVIQNVQALNVKIKNAA